MKETGINTLDRATGGLLSHGAYLLSGDPATGKSSVCLNFLQRGLSAGETAAMITSRPPDQVIEHSKAIGCDVSAHVADRTLLIFEYPENIAEAVATLEDHQHMLDEFVQLLGGRQVDRLVFDTASPLVSSNGQLDGRRLRSMLQAFAALEYCVIYVLDTNSPAPLLNYCRDIVSGSIWLQRDQMTLEGFDGMSLPRTVGFDSSPTSEQTPPTPILPERAPSILVIESDPTRRMLLRSQLERSFTVLEASNAIVASNLARVGEPRAIVISAEVPGSSGKQLAAALRQVAPSALIAGLTDCFPRQTDQISALAGGVDVCLPYGGDDRVLRLSLLKLLERLGPTRSPEVAAEAGRIARPVEQETFAFTNDFKAFCGRIAREALYARQNGIPFAVLAFRLPEIPEAIDELAATLASLMQSPAAVYAGPAGVACLLPETDSTSAFLTQFWNRWEGAVAPAVEEIHYANQDAFLHKAREFVRTRVAAKSSETRPAFARRAVGA